MIAWEWRGDEEVVAVERPRPVPGPGELLLRPLVNGLCATDLELLRGRLPDSRPPLVPGHEIVAAVEAGAAPGTRVVVDTMIGCGECAACLAGRTEICARGTEIGLTTDGGWAEALTVPAANCHPLPAAVGDREAALIEPLSCQLGLIRAHPVAGEEVLVVGSGVAAMLYVQLALDAGATAVTAVVDDPERGRIAQEMGAAAVVLGPQRPPTDGPYALAIDAVGSAGSLELAVAAVRPGGHVSLYGLAEAQPRFELHRAVFKNLTFSAHTSSPGLWVEAIELVATGRMRVEPLITDLVPFAELGRFVRTALAEGPLRGPRLKAVIDHA